MDKLCYENQKASNTLVEIENYSTWQNSKTIALNTTVTGANVGATVTNFPVLLRLNAGNFNFSQSSTGADIRFADNNGNHLSYEIERWDNTNSVAEVWVKVPTVIGNSTTNITMYWGKNGAQSLSSGEGVFATANNYSSVYHLNDVTNIADATVNRATGTNHSTTNVTGIIGKAASLTRASSQYVSLPTSALSGISGTATVSLWTYGGSALPVTESILEAKDGSNNRLINIHLPYSDSTIYWDFGNTGSDRISQKTTNVSNYKNQWNHWVFTHNSSSGNMYVYLNGMLWNSGTGNTRTLGTAATVTLGCETSAANFYDGYVDELEISRTERSADWIKLCYENQKANNTLVDMEDISAWNNNKTLILNTTSATGVGVTTTQTDFPVLVRLTSSNFTFAQAAADGSDIRFTDNRANKLSYQIERWDNVNNLAEVWVKVPTITGNSTTDIKMYWGKGGAVSQSYGENVFNGNNSYKAVYHLNDNAASTTVSDATGLYGAVHKTSNTSEKNITGLVGKALDFNGTIDYVDLPSVGDQSAVTVSVWAKNDGGGEMQGLLSSGIFEAGDIHFRISNNTNFIVAERSSIYVSDSVNFVDNWNYITYSYTVNGTLYCYKNGQLIGNLSLSDSQWNGDNLEIGHEYSDYLSGQRYFNGVLDEVTISSTARSADWIKLCYENQKASSTFPQISSCVSPTLISSVTRQAKNAGETASFSVTLNPDATSPTYQWKSSANAAVWTNVPEANGGKSSSYSFPVTLDGNNTYYKCDITNPCQAIPLAVPVCTLFVCQPCAVVGEPKDTLVRIGDTVRVRVTATGTGLRYQWQRSPAGGSYAVLAADTTGTLTFAALSTDSGALYKCIVSGACGAQDTSNIAVLAVYRKVKAQIFALDSSGTAPLAVTFTDTSTGSYGKFKWIFSDGLVDSTMKTLSHTFSTVGTYFVKLVVSGNGGTDSVTKTVIVSGPGSNPLRLRGTYLGSNVTNDSQMVALNIQNYNAIQSPMPFINVSAVNIRYQKAKIPTSYDSSAQICSYTLATLKSQGTEFNDTVMVPVLPKTESLYGFMTSIVWSDGKVTPFSLTDTSHGTSVFMLDTVASGNLLVLSGTYLPGPATTHDDTARIYIGNIASIDTTRVDSMYVWSSIATDMVDFADENATRGYSMKQVMDSVSGNQFSFSIVNKSFYSDEKTVYAAVYLKGKNDQPSAAKKLSFLVGNKRPVNPVLLVATANGSDEIRLTWNNISLQGVEGIRIWYRKSIPVDTVFDVSALKLDSIIPSIKDTTVLAGNLNPQTRYYFGAQVFKGGRWSQITQLASADATTGVAGGTLDSNTLKIAPLVFDSATNQIHFNWSVNRVVGDSLSIGISYSTSGFPTSDTAVQQYIEVKSDSGTSTLTLHEDLKFLATYYVALWLRTPGGSWTAPTARSRDTVLTPYYTWQQISGFTAANQQILAFNGDISISNKGDNTLNSPNVIRVVTPVPSLIAGTFSAGLAIEFKNKEQIPPFYIGFKIPQLSGNYSIRSVRIYRDSLGVLLLAREPMKVDSIKRYVSLLTNKLDYPFLALVDTTPPVITVASDTLSPVAGGADIVDTLVIGDNIANADWQFFAGRGDDALNIISGPGPVIVHKTRDTLAVTIPSKYVSVDNGVRAEFTISDGVNTCTVDVSRRVMRDTTNIVSFKKMNWTPLTVASDLDMDSLPEIMRTMPGYASSWTYDINKMRVYRWFDNAANADTSWKWVEYSEMLKNDFRVVRGNIIWVKPRLPNTVFLGKSTTPSLKKPFVVRLLPKKFTDIGLPFNFNIRVGDVLAATKAAGSSVDSLWLYEWAIDDATTKYVSRLIYTKDIAKPQLNDPLALLSPMGPGYSVYNNGFDTVRLVFPALPQIMSTIVASVAKETKENGWIVSISTAAADGAKLGTVYCGLNPSASRNTNYYPAGPSFESIRVGVVEQGTKNVFGHAISHSATDGGVSYMLAYVNNTDLSQTVTSSVVVSGSDADVVFFNPQSMQTETRENSPITVDAHSTVYRWVLAGSASYLAKASSRLNMMTSLALVGTWPNPFKNAVRIRYSLPFDGVANVKFAVYSVSGKKMWHKEIKAPSRYGECDLLWNGCTNGGSRLSAGVYILRMTTTGKTRASCCVFERKLMLVQ